MEAKRFWAAAGRLVAATVFILGFSVVTDAASQYKILHRFTGGANGNEYVNLGPFLEYFSSGIVIDAAGNLYGTTPAGGAYGFGLIYELKPNPDGTWKKKVLYSFRGAVDGASPMGSLMLDSAGNLFGTTYAGGKYGKGTVFEIMPKPSGGWSGRLLYSFSGGQDGASPMVGVIFDQTGNLYGAADGGGDYGGGTIFKLTPNPDGSWTQSVLHSFSGGWDGSAQLGGLAFDPAGNLYGTGQSASSAGVVFRLTPNPDGTWTDTVLHTFDGNDGWDPFSFSGLVLDAAGSVYGTAFWNHGTAAGVVFKLTPSQDGTWTESDVYSFTGGADGEHPEAGVIFDAAGNLYGATPFGGDYDCYHGPFSDGCGVIFRLTPKPDGTWKETVLHTFHNHPGAHSFAGVTLDSAGNLYGTTSGDGVTTFGTVFEITP